MSLVYAVVCAAQTNRFLHSKISCSVCFLVTKKPTNIGTPNNIQWLFLLRFLCIHCMINVHNVKRRHVKTWSFPPGCIGESPSLFSPSALPSLSSEYINIWKCWLRPKNTHGLNKVQSDFRVWDLQINPAWMSWGPGSGINCYISWPSSCCLSQPAWPGPGLARNHGLRAQQCGHFPRRKKPHRPRGFTEQTRWALPNAPRSHISQSLFLLPSFPLCSGPSMELWEGTRQFWVERETEM